MELIRGLHQLRDRHKGCVLTIGNFDGVHLGHKEVLKRLQKQAKAMQLPMAVMVFEPQPSEFFLGKSAPARLTRLRDKYIQLSRLGVDRLLVAKFNQEFANQSANQFIEELLVERLNVKMLVVGDDFCFGAQRKGDFHRLQRAGKKHDFQVLDTQSFCLDADRVSSTYVRQALENNDLQTAEAMLGRPYSISGRVAHGRKLGRTIGFPTANVLLKRLVSPIMGVYAVEVYAEHINMDAKSAQIEAKPLLGVANIGHRPTVNGIRQQLEVHIFDFDKNLYGEHIEVVLRHKLREEKKFASFERLKVQIQQDALTAKEWLLANSNIK